MFRDRRPHRAHNSQATKARAGGNQQSAPARAGQRPPSGTGAGKVAALRPLKSAVENLQGDDLRCFLRSRGRKLISPRALVIRTSISVMNRCASDQTCGNCLRIVSTACWHAVDILAFSKPLPHVTTSLSVRFRTRKTAQRRPRAAASAGQPASLAGANRALRSGILAGVIAAEPTRMTEGRVALRRAGLGRSYRLGGCSALASNAGTTGQQRHEGACHQV